MTDRKPSDADKGPEDRDENRLRALLQVLDRPVHMPRLAKQWFAALTDALILPAALWSALALRYGYVDFNPERFAALFLLAPLVTIPVFAFLGLYRAVIRYIGSRALGAIVKGVSVSALAITAAAYLLPVAGFPRSAPAIYWMIALLYVAGTRLLVRSYVQWLTRRFMARRPALIYGAGDSGIELARLLQAGSRYAPLAFIDQDRQLQHGDIDGIPVYAPGELVWVISHFEIETVLLALPSASRAERKLILDQLTPLRRHVLTVPPLHDLISGRRALNQFRDVAVEDLLGRDPVPPDGTLLRACVTDRCVLITGAGGSIGSELCRQIARQRPARLVLFEVSEFALYRMQQELIAAFPDLPLDAVVGNVQDEAHLARVLELLEVETLYHAAAYKHVPLVEQNVVEGVRNNVFGTLCAARAAIRCGIEHFVMVSTDKAVCPVNVMGATKRCAELVLMGLEESSDLPRFSIVRFGNVLDSSGSVVPLFREQIERGGPVTVTHERVERYFMTIPEAAELVLQAGAMSKSAGGVYVLDMGEPVRILDLATKMITLMGHSVRSLETPEGDVEIQFTGLRPGEKLREELYESAYVAGTAHPKILRASEATLAWDTLAPLLDALRAACERHDVAEVRRLLERITDSEFIAEPQGQLAVRRSLPDAGGGVRV